MENISDMPAKPMSLHEFRKRRRPLRNINVEMRENLSRLNRIAVWITTHVGTMGFFLLIVVWTIAWLGWNFLAPEALKFDAPMGFVFWLFLSNLIQILLMPLIMVSQNVIGRHAEARAEHDLQINMKNEHEIEVILHHLEHQNEILVAMMQKLGGEVGAALSQVKRAPQWSANVSRMRIFAHPAHAVGRHHRGPGAHVDATTLRNDAANYRRTPSLSE
jgi:uncharacterized membrane protein